MNNGVDAPRQVLKRIGGEAYAESEIGEVASTSCVEAEKRTLFWVFSDKGLRRAMVLGVLLAVFQQWCGINVVFNYA